MIYGGEYIPAAARMEAARPLTGTVIFFLVLL
jgi:hypothetical protein